MTVIEGFCKLTEYVELTEADRALSMGLGDTPRMEDVFARREPQLLLVEFVDEVLIACRA